MRNVKLSEVTTFSNKIATKVGVNAAIVHAKLAFYIINNKQQNRNFEDGAYWTFITIEELHQALPFLTIKQIRTAVQKLKEKNAITTGKHYNGKYRTTWYTIDERILQMAYKQLPSRALDNALQGTDNCPQGQYNNSIRPSIRQQYKEKRNIKEKERFCSYQEYSLWRPLLPQGNFNEKHYDYCKELRSEYGQDNTTTYLNKIRLLYPEADIPTVLDKTAEALSSDYRAGLLH